MFEKRILLLIIGLFILLGCIYACVTPVFEASDELWHYPMIRHLADGNPLPVQVFDPAEAGPWKQEASQPPLYYYLGAALTFWIDTSDMKEVRWLNPHVDNGVLTADGNINLVVHDPANDPWSGTLLAVRLVRVFSVLLGTVTVYLTYRIAKETAPKRPEIALGAAAVNAFLPMFLFISGAVNNDNLVIPLASLSLLLMIRIVKYSATRNVDEQRREIILMLLLGFVIGLGALSKITALGLILLALGTIVLARWRSNEPVVDGRGMLRVLWQSSGRFLLVMIPVLVVAGWWYARNIQLYGDWNGWSAFIAVLGQRAHSASLAQLWDERWGFMSSYWGLFGGLNVPMSEWIYHLLNTVLLVSVLGFIVYSVQIILASRDKIRRRVHRDQSLFSALMAIVIDNFALILCILWAVAVVAGLIQWATTTWSSQGRLVFSAISALSTLMVLGLVGWAPRRPAAIIVGCLSIFMFAISALAPFLWIRPAYQPAQKTLPLEFRIANIDFGNVMQLKGYGLNNEKTLIPGDALDVWLEWVVLDEIDQDWSIFVHLQDPILEVPIAQRDMYPRQGLRATSILEPGDRFVDHFQLQIPTTAIGPGEFPLSVGLYGLFSGERLLTADGSDAVLLTNVPLESVQGTVPNPLNVRFENDLHLVGYKIEPRRLQPGEGLSLTLFWQPHQTLEKDFTFFAQVVGEDTTRWASHDLSQPTTSWNALEVYSMTMDLTMQHNTPIGVYPIIIGVYTRTAEGDFDRLQTVTDEGRLTDDFLNLSQIRVD